MHYVYFIAFENRYVTAHEMGDSRPFFADNPQLYSDRTQARRHAAYLIRDYVAAGLPKPKLFICKMNRGSLEEVQRTAFRPKSL